MARNRYDVDETLETPFNIHHLLRAGVYIKRHLAWGSMEFLFMWLHSRFLIFSRTFYGITTKKLQDKLLVSENIFWFCYIHPCDDFLGVFQN